jgi:hypothetical protein
MPLASTDFVAKGGSYYAHLFENPSAGVPRALYWSFTVDFESIRYVGGSWRSSFTVEWITLGAREFAGARSISSSSSPGAEASLYLAEHHPIDRWNGRVSWETSPPHCVLDYDAQLDFRGLDRDPVSGLHLTGKACLEFDGFIVVPGNLFPKPASIEEAGDLLRQYFPEPGVAVDEGRRYVFRP